MKTRSRLWRRRYYDLFSRFYDRFIALHARKDESDTRSFLAESAAPKNKKKKIDLKI
jgi:hypothetical protein